MSWILPAIIALGAVAVVTFIVWLVLSRGERRSAARPWLIVAAVAGIGCGVLGALLAIVGG